MASPFAWTRMILCYTAYITFFVALIFFNRDVLFLADNSGVIAPALISFDGIAVIGLILKLADIKYRFDFGTRAYIDKRVKDQVEALRVSLNREMRKEWDVEMQKPAVARMASMKSGKSSERAGSIDSGETLMGDGQLGRVRAASAT